MKKERIKPRELLAILQQQNFRCAYTGEQLTPQTASADHRIPVSRGGAHDASNIVIVTKQINAMKGALPLDVFIRLCGMVYTHAGSPNLNSGPYAEAILIDDSIVEDQ